MREEIINSYKKVILGLAFVFSVFMPGPVSAVQLNKPVNPPEDPPLTVQRGKRLPSMAEINLKRDNDKKYCALLNRLWQKP